MNLKRQNPAFLSGVLSILLSQLFVKLMGLLYRLVITNIDGFGDVGNGFYTAGFQLYTLLLAISSVGIPSAVSRLVSVEAAGGNLAGADRIFQAALGLFTGIGLACSAGLFFGADWIAVLVIRMDGVQDTLRALSPSVTFVCISSVIRGYFLGLGDVRATGRSQMLEQVFKSVLTVVFVLVLTSCSASVMSAGANFATTAATAASAVYLMGYSLRRRPARAAAVRRGRGRGTRGSRAALCRTIWKVSFPISLGSIITGIGRVIDTATITRGIQAAFAGGIPGRSGLPTAAELNAEAVRLAGMLSKSDSILNLPLALNIAFATVLVPAISSALAVGRRREAEETITLSLLISVLLAFPCAAGLIVLAGPIYQMIYPNAPMGYQLLQISALGMFFSALGQTINGSLQGMGRVGVPARALFCGVAAKVALNHLLIRIPSVNIFGAAVGSLVCYLTSSGISFCHLKKELALPLPGRRYVWKPLLCTGGMSAVAAAVYPLLLRCLHSNTLSILLTIGLSAAVYLALVLAAGILTRRDVAQFPISGRLRKWLLKLVA